MITTTNRPAASCFLLKEGCTTSSSCFRCSSHSSRISSTKPSDSRLLPGDLLRDFEGLLSPRALLTATKNRARVTPTVAAGVWCIPSRLARELTPARAVNMMSRRREVAEPKTASWPLNPLHSQGQQRWMILPLAQSKQRCCRQVQVREGVVVCSVVLDTRVTLYVLIGEKHDIPRCPPLRGFAIRVFVTTPTTFPFSHCPRLRRRMAASLHQIARGGVVEEGEDFFREVTDSKGEQAANAIDGMQR